jgi:hypothetical protein
MSGYTTPGPDNRMTLLAPLGTTSTGKVYGGIAWGFYVRADGFVLSSSQRYLPGPSKGLMAAVGLWNLQAKGDLAEKNSGKQVALPALIDLNPLAGVLGP